MVGGAVTVSPPRRLWELVAPDRGEIGVVVLFGIAVGLLTLVVPIATQALVNTAAFGTLLQPLLVLAFIVFTALSASGVLHALQLLVTERLQRRLFVRIAIDLAYRFPRASLDGTALHPAPELVNRFLDVVNIQKSAAFLLVDGITILLQAVVGVLLLALYHPYLIAFDALLIAMITFVVFVLGRGAVRTSLAESHAKYAVLAWLEELTRAPLTFRIAGGTALAMRRADHVTTEWIGARRSHFRVVFRQVVGTLVVQALASGLLLGLGGWLVSRQQLTLGQLVAAELIVTPLVYRFARFGKYLEALYDLLAGADNLGVLFDVPIEREGGAALAGAGPIDVQLRRASFAHHPRVPLLEDVCLELPAGSRTAILGLAGSGKSSLADLIAGLRAPDTGSIELGGVDVSEIAPDALRASVELVRGAAPFEGTIDDNLRLDREGIGAAEARAALEAVGLLDEILLLPDGLATRITAEYAPLSESQALRLVIARALLGRPRLLVLDETLDALAGATLDRALEVLLAPEAPHTLVILTRRPEVARRCPRVLSLAGGKLTEAAA